MSAGMRAIFSLKERDRGWKKLMAMAKRISANRPYAKAGIIGARAQKKHTTEEDVESHRAAKAEAKRTGQKAPKRKASGPSNVELALIHEFGAPSVGVPERSFIRSSFDRNRPKYESTVRTLIEKMYEGKMEERQALGILGLMMSTDMKLGVVQGAGIQPPNSARTLARKAAKGKSKNGLGPRALVDTGQMVGALSWQVVLNGSTAAQGDAP